MQGPRGGFQGPGNASVAGAETGRGREWQGVAEAHRLGFGAAQTVYRHLGFCPERDGNPLERSDLSSHAL